MNKEEFVKEVEKLGISVDDKILKSLNTYYEMLIDYNSHTNLTRITDEEDVYLKHFYDSLTLIKAVKLNNQTLLDVGTGAGFPGLVLKIVFPNLKVTLVDSLNKRIIFLKSVIEKLNLKGINAIHERIEDYAKTSRESFDIVTSRAVASLPVLSEMCIPLVCEKGLFIPMKADAKGEIKSSQNAIKTLGGVLRDTILFKLPKDAGERTLIIIEKINKTKENLKHNLVICIIFLSIFLNSILFP